MRRALVVDAMAVALCGLGMNACAMEPPTEEDLASVSEEWGITACSGVASDYHDDGEINPVHTSPANYDTCYKSYVVDLWYPYTTGVDTHIKPQWTAEQKANQTSCENLFLGVIEYHRSGGVWEYQTTTRVRGTWYPQSGRYAAHCFAPEYTHTLWSGIPHPSHRFAVTARPYDSSAAPVVPVKIGWFIP